MKKNYLLTLAVMFSVSNSFSSLPPDGSIVPDFTATDINGNEINLYSLLDSGYTVVLDFTATWCMPCWDYHTAHHLKDLWEDHGPAGADGVNANTTDDVYVIF